MDHIPPSLIVRLMRGPQSQKHSSTASIEQLAFREAIVDDDSGLEGFVIPLVPSPLNSILVAKTATSYLLLTGWLALPPLFQG